MSGTKDSKSLGRVEIRKADERGTADLGWLKSRHTFSFGEYYDPRHMGFRSLRVINEDRVEGGGGFPAHPHRDMEIISYVLEGELQHRDSMGNGSVIRPDEVQRMSAGTGVTHSEQNASSRAQVHFLQIWIVPERRGLAPGYEQKRLDAAKAHGQLLLLGSQDGRNDSVTIHQDANLYLARLGTGQTVEQAVAAGRGIWVHVTRGKVAVNGQALAAGDGAAIEESARLTLTGLADAEVLVFDMK